MAPRQLLFHNFLFNCLWETASVIRRINANYLTMATDDAWDRISRKRFIADGALDGRSCHRMNDDDDHTLVAYRVESVDLSE